MICKMAIALLIYPCDEQPKKSRVIQYLVKIAETMIN